MHRRPVVAAILGPAGRFQPVEDAVDHVQGGAEDEIPGRQFHRRPLGALAKTDEALDRDVDVAFKHSPLDGLGDFEAAADGARRLAGLETPVDADQNRFRRQGHARGSRGNT